MGLLDTMRTALTPAPDFSGSKPRPFRGERLTDPVVVPSTQTQGQSFFSSFDNLSAEQRRKAYRSTVFFLANYRAKAFARHMLEVTVERRTGQDEYEAVEVEHPWVQLLRRPNDYMAPLEVYLWLFLNRDLSRGAHFIVEHETRQGGAEVPVALHPVFASYGSVSPVLGGVGEYVGWRFDRADGQTVALRPQDVIRVGHESPFQRGRAMSLIEAAAFEMDEHFAASVYARDAAEDQGRPEVLLEAEDTVPAAEGNRISRQFAQKYRAGSQNRGVPFTSGGLKAKQFQLTQRDMQFLELRGFNRTQLYEMFEVQESLFSDEAYATGRQAAFVWFALNTVEPNLLVALSQMEHGFERAFRADPAALRLAMPDVVPSDEKQKAEVDDIRLKNGTATINEVRRRDGEEEVEGGDEPMVPATLQTLSAATGGVPATEDF